MGIYTGIYTHFCPKILEISPKTAENTRISPDFDPNGIYTHRYIYPSSPVGGTEFRVRKRGGTGFGDEGENGVGAPKRGNGKWNSYPEREGKGVFFVWKIRSLRELNPARDVNAFQMRGF